MFTGQYSSGKSTLIKALTDGRADVMIDSDVSTDSVTEYDWDGLVRLVDTPGVQAGVREHDLLSDAAVARADLVLFCVTVDLFDDAAVRYLRKIIDTLEKKDQLIVVVTKANTMQAAPGVRRAAVLDALGAGNSTVPFVECDARDYLDGLDERDPSAAAEYRELSNLSAVRSAINAVLQKRGDLARYWQPVQVIIKVAADAEALLTDDPEEAAALRTLPSSARR